MEHLVNRRAKTDQRVKVPKVIKHANKPTLTPLFFKDSRYFPLTTTALTSSTQLIWIAVYIIIWIGIFLFSYKPSFLFAYTFSFATGLVLFIAELYYTSKDNWLVLNTKDNEAYELSIDKKTGANSISSNDRWLIYADDKHLPASDDKAYLVESEKVNELQTKKGMKLIPLGAMYDGLFSKTVNIGSQEKVRYFSEYNTQLGQNCFYIIVLILAWSMYVVKTKWFRIKHVHWVLVAIAVSTLGGVLTSSPTTVRDSNHLVEIKKKILVMALSFASASILIN